MKTTLAVLLLSTVAICSGQSPAPAGEVLFFDDFAGLELDRSKWGVIVTGRTVNNEQQAYVDSKETISSKPATRP